MPGSSACGLTASDWTRPRPRHTADATVRGTAADLLLLVYGRLSYEAEALAHEGDEHLLGHWFANSAI
ncbi:hypothetical protein [Streptomyces coeruleofuscus]|uniref:MDMPI C-terminal domain-containing protein n=1 Tax=Streptomyces coeruleofuscus TaxID=66879 RepID=A0ABP5W1S7_9ACTN